tara:strand:- start:242 stop:790 length:549 start_codon:yes stop_codon:yes gene_type:complete
MKNILKIIVGFLVAGVLYVGYMVAFPVSPLETVTYSSEISDFEVVYSRPYKNDRLIFGLEADGALVPFRQYWRTGANAATTFETSDDIVFGDKKLRAGKYRLYSVPQEEAWSVTLNSEADKLFAISEPDYSKDIITTKLPSRSDLETAVEQFTIDFSQDSLGLNMNLFWDKTILSIPLNPLK